MPSRVEDRPLPPVDCGHGDPENPAWFFAGAALHQAIGRTLRDDGQVLFLNLRGYSPTVWRHCGKE